MDTTTLDEVTTMITDFNPNLTKYYPTLAIVNTLIDIEVKTNKYYLHNIIINSHMCLK